jgi:acetyltransferase-like isoleucine patch superfamily enzyme
MKLIVKVERYYYGKIYHLIYGGVKYAKYLGVSVGENCRIYTKDFGSEPFLITIGNHVTVTSGVTFITHDGSGWLFSDERGRRYYYSPIKIGNNVFIGVNTIIMPGVKIEDNVIVAAGSIITKSIPSNSIVGGVPAKIIGSTFQFRSKVLRDWVTQEEMDIKSPYYEKIKRLADYSLKPFLKSGN